MQTPPSQSRSQFSCNQWLRHPNNTTAVPRRVSILIEDQYLFEIDVDQLRQHEAVLKDVQSTPSDLPLDGTPDNPVAIPYLSGDECSQFMNWFNQRSWSPERASKAALVGFLAISHYFIVTTGVEWSINCLDSLDSEEALTPAHRLQLAFRYEIEKWIRRAVDDIFDRQEGGEQLGLLSNGEIEQMGMHAFVLIAHGIETVKASRISVALDVPSAHHSPQCRLSAQRERDCTHAWGYFWCGSVQQVLLAADQPMPLHDLASFLRRTEIESVDNACKLLTLSNFEMSGVHTVELTARKEVASGIWELYREGCV